MCRKFKISQTTFASIWNCDSSAKKTTTLPRHPGMCSECFGGQAGLMELGSFGSDILNFTSIFDTKNHRWISSVQKKVAFKSQRMRQNPETNRQKHLKIDPKGKGNSYWKTTIFRFETVSFRECSKRRDPTCFLTISGKLCQLFFPLWKIPNLKPAWWILWNSGKSVLHFMHIQQDVDWLSWTLEFLPVTSKRLQE